MIENKTRACLLLAALAIALPGTAFAQIYAPRTVYGTSNYGTPTYGTPTYGTTGIGGTVSGISTPASPMGVQNGLMGPQNGGPNNGSAMLKTAQGAQSTITQKAPMEGQANAGGQTVHYQVADPNADGAGTGSDIVTDGLPKRVFDMAP